jgi:tRNA 2-thiocytidine biosynthesis protein TtcA
MHNTIEKKLLHYTGLAIADFNMIRHNDRVLACLSGGKDSYCLVNLLHLLQLRSKAKFQLHVLVVDAALPNWNGPEIKQWLESNKLEHTILKTNIFEIAKQKERPGDSYCILCSRLRRGYIYSFAKENNFNKIALGHHREDLITSLLMSIFYNGVIGSMPPKLLTNDKKLIVIRPLAYCHEVDLIAYAHAKKFPLTPKGICGAKENMARQKVHQLIMDLAKTNPKIPNSMLHAMKHIKVSQLMDESLWDFKNLEQSCR